MKIAVVCYANYCRSPVAEIILKSLLPDDWLINSFGLSPFLSSGMDKRSIKFLEKKGYETLVHTPKRLGLEQVKNYDIIYVLDMRLLFRLNKLYSKYSYKLKVLNFNDLSLNLSDPYKLNDEDYSLIMNNIEKSCFMIEKCINN